MGYFCTFGEEHTSPCSFFLASVLLVVVCSGTEPDEDVVTDEQSRGTILDLDVAVYAQN